MLVHGTQNGDVPFAHGQFAAERVPGAQRYWMERGDHLGFWLSPEAGEAQAVASTFLQRHAPGS